MLSMSKMLAAASMVAVLGLTGCASTSQEAAAPIKTVYHINDSTNAMLAMNNIRNQLAASPTDQVVVVTHGKGIDFLLEDATDKDGNPYKVRVDELIAKKVDFRVCNNTLTGRKIDPKTVLPGANIVPSGVAEVAKLQAKEGYTYIKP
jgi:intracellular sulfur oxidation DsrE/DsrF family protein